MLLQTKVFILLSYLVTFISFYLFVTQFRSLSLVMSHLASSPLSLLTIPYHTPSHFLSQTEMRLFTSISLAWACLQVHSFAPKAVPNRISSSVESSKVVDEAPCAIPSEFTNDASSLVNVSNGANPIRSGIVTNYAGDSIQLGNVISKSDPHVVIFLRHMG